MNTVRSSRRAEYALAGIIAAVALAISPPGILFFSGRIDLSFRNYLISGSLSLFLALLAGAILTRAGIRRVFFWLMFALLPVVLLCGIEAVAEAVQLATWVAPTENLSVLANRARYPAYLRSGMAAISRTEDGLVLYKPLQGGGVTINALGLRAPMPSPKAPGEWRVAVTGGSTAWGWEILDADTIASQLQDVLANERGQKNVKVYNFGVGGRVLREELGYVKRFRKIYGIDQVVFYTGGNDAIYSYVNQFNKAGDASEVSYWEIVKTVQRLQVKLFPPSAAALAHLDNEILPRLRVLSPVRSGVLAADEYCRAEGMRCDFILQPILALRKSSTGVELEMQRTLNGIYPRQDRAAAEMYADAMAAGPPDRMHDFSRMFDETPQNFFADAIHVNEIANRLIARRIADSVQFGPR